jgi:hypothetical protein
VPAAAAVRPAPATACPAGPLPRLRLSAVTPDHTGTALLTLRLAVTAGSLAAPKATGTLPGVDVEANPAASCLARAFGVRDGWLPALRPRAGEI